MKILHITASYKPAYTYGGPIVSVSRLCECLTRAQSRKLKAESEKIDLEVFTTTANGRNELDVEVGKPVMVNNVPVTYFKRWTKDHSHFSPGIVFHLNKTLRQAQDDNIKLIIHIHAWWNLVSVLSCLVAKWYKVPVVLSPRGMLNFHTYSTGNKALKKIIHLSIGRKLLKYCVMHATTNKEKAEIVDFINNKDITVISNLVGPGKLDFKFDKEKQTNETFKIVFLSRINPIKGLELLFDALSILRLDYHLTIAGTGDENYIKSLKRKAESLKLSGRIKWLGQITAQDKFELLAEHDLLVLTSYNENFANVVIESLSVGTPVLVSEQVGLADYVKSNGLGWICSLEPKDIANKITMAYDETLKSANIRVNAPTLINNDFDDEVLAAKYIELYEEVHRHHSQ